MRDVFDFMYFSVLLIEFVIVIECYCDLSMGYYLITHQEFLQDFYHESEANDSDLKICFLLFQLKFYLHGEKTFMSVAEIITNCVTALDKI